MTGFSYHILVSGKVQGVYFRQSARQQARLLGISGTVENLPDGRVELVASGDPAALEQFLEWCRRGPMMARVEAVEHRQTDFKYFEDFLIL